MELATLVVFLLVYLGMILGSWPGLALDRTGIALLGAIAMIELQGISIAEAAQFIDYPTIAILFSFMILSGQFYYSGFYTHLIERIGQLKLTPPFFLLLILFISASCSAFLINDIVCLAMTPLLIKICVHKHFNPLPFLLGLACASNIGSGLTLIGNPQNMLIGQVLNLSFIDYTFFAFPVCLMTLMSIWGVICFLFKDKWHKETLIPPSDRIDYHAWQSWKGGIVILVLVFLFILTNLPRDRLALMAAGFLLLSRKMTSQTMLSFIDWQLLVLFIGLFIVNKSFLHNYQTLAIPETFRNFHIDMSSPLSISLVSLGLSNLVSNVPAVMLILPFIDTSFDGTILALSSTLAGNLTIVGSIANLIVVAQASKFNILIDWKSYLKVGFPVTLISFALTLGWLYLYPFFT